MSANKRVSGNWKVDCTFAMIYVLAHVSSYKLDERSVTHTNAQINCQLLNGNLVSIPNADVNEFLKTELIER